MIVVQQVLGRPLAELRVSDLTHHGLAVRKLIGCIDELPARGKALLKELVDQMEWSTPEVWETCTEQETERHESPSAAQLGMLIGRSDRTVRRAYEDAEQLGLLTRHRRGWNTNRFSLHLGKLLELAQESQAGRLERRLAMLRAWQGGYQDESGRFAPRPGAEPSGASSDAGAGAPADQVHEDAPTEPAASDLAYPSPPMQLSAEQLREAFAAFPAEYAEYLIGVLHEARALVAQRGVLHWKSLGATPKERRLELGALCVAVHTLGAPDQPADVRIHCAGTWAGRLGAVWAEMGYGPIGYILRDIYAFRLCWGSDWPKKARPRAWNANAETALAYVRRRAPGWADAPAPGDYHDAPEQLDDAPEQLDDAPEQLDDAPEWFAPSAAEDAAAQPTTRAEVRAILDRHARDVTAWRSGLEALPPLPEVKGAPHDPERRRVNAERLARGDLSRALQRYGSASVALDLKALQEALQAAAAAAEALGVATPP